MVENILMFCFAPCFFHNQNSFDRPIIDCIPGIHLVLSFWFQVDTIFSILFQEVKHTRFQSMRYTPATHPNDKKYHSSRDRSRFREWHYSFRKHNFPLSTTTKVNLPIFPPWLFWRPVNHNSLIRDKLKNSSAPKFFPSSNPDVRNSYHSAK